MPGMPPIMPGCGMAGYIGMAAATMGGGAITCCTTTAPATLQGRGSKRVAPSWWRSSGQSSAEVWRKFVCVGGCPGARRTSSKQQPLTPESGCDGAVRTPPVSSSGGSVCGGRAGRTGSNGDGAPQVAVPHCWHVFGGSMRHVPGQSDPHSGTGHRTHGPLFAPPGDDGSRLGLNVLSEGSWAGSCGDPGATSSVGRRPPHLQHALVAWMKAKAPADRWFTYELLHGSGDAHVWSRTSDQPGRSVHSAGLAAGGAAGVFSGFSGAAGVSGAAVGNGSPVAGGRTFALNGAL